MPEVIQTLERLHQHFSRNPDVATDLEHVTEGCLFFALRRHDPKGWFAKVCWWLWGKMELHAQPLLRILDLVLSVLPKSVRERWAWLRNYRYNGSAYALSAVGRGAGLVIVDNGRFTDQRVLRVKNAREAFFQFAREHRLRQRATVIGITGSCGKTTTKEFVARLLATSFEVVATEGSFNTFEGVCLTLLKIRPTTDFAVLEISSSGGNDVEEKSRIALPDVGIITVIGKAHLLGFGGVDGVRQVKRKLFDVVMERGGQLVVNKDNPDVVALAGDYPRVISFGRNEIAGISGSAVVGATPLTVVWRSPDLEDHTVTTQLFGAYNLDNILAAVGVAREFGVPAKKIDAALASYTPDNMRSQLLEMKDGVTVVLDAYNANPTSVTVALRDFCAMPSRHRTVILGDMLELGAYSAAEHQAVIDEVQSMPLDTVYLVGQEFGKLKCGPKIRWFEDVRALLLHLQSSPLVNTSVLIKGSRGMALERLLALWPSGSKSTR